MSSRSFEKWLFGKWGPLEKSILSWGKDVVWPEDAFCCACGRISDRDGLCAACRESLEHDGFFFAWERSDPAPDLPVWSLRPHGGVPRELVIRLKYGAEARAARILAGLLLPLPEDVSFPPDTVVTWVTMPESRRRERAVDHGRLLAEAFAEKLSLPCRQLLLRRDRRDPIPRSPQPKRKPHKNAGLPRPPISEGSAVRFSFFFRSRCFRGSRQPLPPGAPPRPPGV